VKSVHKAAGDRLKVDEVIIEFDYSDPVAK
jgi:hypothetical protein